MTVCVYEQEKNRNYVMATDYDELIFQKWGNGYCSLISLNESYIVCEHLLCVFGSPFVIVTVAALMYKNGTQSMNKLYKKKKHQN